MTPSRLTLHLLMAFIALVSLAAAAIAFTAHEDSGEYWGVMLFTLFVLALAAPVTTALHRPQYQSAALCLLCILILLWPGIVLLALHDILHILSQTKILGTLITILLAGIPAAIALAVRSKPWGKTFCRTLVPLAVLAAFAALIAIWCNPESGSTLFENIIATAGWTFLFAGSGTLLLINVDRGDKRYFRWPGLAAAFLATLGGIVMVWTGEDKARIWGFVANIAWLITITLALINLLLMTRHAGLVRLTQRFAILFTLLAGAALIAFTTFQFRYPALDPNDPNISLFARACIATLFLTVGATLSLLVARSLLRIKSLPIAPAGIDHLEIRCPNCGTSQRLGLKDACHHCLLKFRITLIEPHCPDCDHILLNLTSDRCPECGASLNRPPIPTPAPPPIA